MTFAPLILALDTATTGCSVCVWQNGAVLATLGTEMARGQAEVLMPMVQDVLGQAGVQAQDLTAIAVTNGPGAFTGLRIGLSAARGLALALNIPCVGITTLEVLAYAVDPKERTHQHVLACVESKRADIYVQLFNQDLQSISDPLAKDGPALVNMFQGGEKLVLVGDAAERAKDFLANSNVQVSLSTASALPDPALIAALAVSRLDGAATPQPLYLRPPDAKLPRAQGRARA